MTRFTLIAAATALLAAPSFAQSTTEVAEEILNADADTASEVVDATPVEGAEDCMDPAAEQLNEDADSVTDEIGCTQDVDGTPAAGAEIFEDLEAESDDDDSSLNDG